jgi:hypothetical protein
MGDTLPLPGRGRACLGRSVTSWTSGSGLSPGCSRARRWPPCAEFGISRNTGYKIYDRYKDCGVGALTCEALSTTQEKFAFTVFERTFKDFGLPGGIRTDNGVPFASADAIYAEQTVGLVAAAGHRDRTHYAGPSATKWPPRADASDAEKRGYQPAAANALQQQARFDAFVTETTRSGRIRRWA